MPCNLAYTYPCYTQCAKFFESNEGKELSEVNIGLVCFSQFCLVLSHTSMDAYVWLK